MVEGRIELCDLLSHMRDSAFTSIHAVPLGFHGNFTANRKRVVEENRVATEGENGEEIIQRRLNGIKWKANKNKYWSQGWNGRRKMLHSRCVLLQMDVLGVNLERFCDG